MDGYAGTVDTTLVRDGGLPAGTDATLQLSWQAIGQDAARPLLAFDLTSVPVTATIISAVLDLSVVTPDPQPITVTVQPLLRLWNEPYATWLDAYIGAPWIEPGAGPSVSTASRPGTAPGAAGRQHRTARDLTGLVGAWVANPNDNFGVLLQAQGVAGVDVNLLLASRESDNIAPRPRLTVTYTGTPDDPTPPRPTPRCRVKRQRLHQRPVRPKRVYRQGLDGFQGFYDATLSSTFPDTNYGGASDLSANWITYFYPPQVEGNSLLRVDLWDIPADATIDGAELSLFLLERSAPQQVTLRVYELLRHWSEAETTWHRNFTRQTWSVPARPAATSTAATPSAEISLDMSRGWITIPLTSLVQSGLRSRNKTTVSFWKLLPWVTTTSSISLPARTTSSRACARS
ncbi:MAG: DNRLRE domain-containing protein [Anaerolineae bacterium]|nr:MAG: DNRLRE domain-containing protein [Anaerolineae bacterium]